METAERPPLSRPAAARADAPRLFGLAVPGWLVRRLGEARIGIALELVRFAVVGALGFVVDAGVLRLGLIAGVGPWVGRLLSYLSAASATYALNRAWTFRHRAGAGGAGQWARFVVVNLGGFAANYGTYAVLLVTTEVVARWPELGVAAGSLAGLLVNFSLSRRFVFNAAAS